MKLVTYGVIGGAVWLWVEQPFVLAVGVALICGAFVGFGLRSMTAQPSVTVLGGEGVSRMDDPTETRLVRMGFRAEEVRPLLAKARAKGETDPAGYVMRSLIR